MVKANSVPAGLYRPHYRENPLMMCLSIGSCEGSYTCIPRVGGFCPLMRGKTLLLGSLYLISIHSLYMVEHWQMITQSTSWTVLSTCAAPLSSPTLDLALFLSLLFILYLYHIWRFGMLNKHCFGVFMHCTEYLALYLDIIYFAHIIWHFIWIY